MSVPYVIYRDITEHILPMSYGGVLTKNPTKIMNSIEKTKRKHEINKDLIKYPWGDGKACERIVKYLNHFSGKWYF